MYEWLFTYFEIMEKLCWGEIMKIVEYVVAAQVGPGLLLINLK